MGSFLDKPKTEKETHLADGLDLHAGVSAMQGWRVDMEDAHVVQIGIPGEPTYSFFAVFDGHGGSFVSKKSAVELLTYIRNTSEWQSGDRSPAVIQEAMRKGFLALDAALQQTPEVLRNDDHSGSTAITALVTPTHIFVGNCGDSRAILVREGNAVEMSHDHKPYLPQETARIEAAGGTVAMRRVNGDLAVSRALGDFTYKQSKNLKPEAQQVSAEPEFIIQERNKDTDQYLVLACDGIWDVMTNQDVATFVVRKTEDGIDNLGTLAENLIDEGLIRNSRDNMSAIIVGFPAAPHPTPEAIAAYQARLAQLQKEKAESNLNGGGEEEEDNE